MDTGRSVANPADPRGLSAGAQVSRLMDPIETQVCVTAPTFALSGGVAVAPAREEIVA
jgi:hypothetical protein